MKSAYLMRSRSIIRRLLLAVAPLLVAGVTGCSFADIVGDPSSTSETIASPSSVKTPQGALEFYRGVVQLQAFAVRDFVSTTGKLTDELSSFSSGEAVDFRILPVPSSEDRYTQLQIVRANARQGRGLLPKYAPALPQAYVAHLYAIEAMADIMLADLFCSGIPLSTVDFEGDFSLRAGSSTAAVYQEAVALFDSAIARSTDSAYVRHFAQVGKGRALLSLGDYATAAAAVSDVPNDYVYNTEYRYSLSVDNMRGNGFYRSSASEPYEDNKFTVSDYEGRVGVPYVSGGDPRSAITPEVGRGSYPLPIYVAKKYDMTGETPIVIASGIEARLIEAEAALRANDVPTWATRLNDLRANAGVFMNPAVPAIFALGADSTTGLTPDARVDLLFRERAYWLFLTGHRQGDLRRLVRRVAAGGFGRPQETVYPSGLYFGGDGVNIPMTNVYGSDVNIAVPFNEQRQNPLYTGCINREA